MIRMPRSLEKAKEINFQSCNYLHQGFKAWTFFPSLVYCAQVFVWQQNGLAEGRRAMSAHTDVKTALTSANTAGLGVLRGCSLHLLPPVATTLQSKKKK